MRILYEDNHILVVAKPPNLPVQADSSGDADLLTLLKAYIKEKYQKPGDVYLGLVHRLDRPVGGVMVVARTSKAAQRLCAQFAGRQAAKRYVAIVEGNTPEEERLANAIARDERLKTAWIAQAGEPGAKEAVLSYVTLAKDQGGRSLVDVSLVTGRKHQIRLQLSHRGFPILHDQRYNKNAKPGNQICLWAYELRFVHPTLKTELCFHSLPGGGPWNAFSAAVTALPAREYCAGVYADPWILCVAKEAGIEVAAADGGDASLEAKLTPLFGPLYPVHRLDANTRGLVLFARTEEAEQALSAAIREGLLEKYYQCVVAGTPPKREDMLRAYWKKDPGGALVEVSNREFPGSKPIRTGYRVVAKKDGLSLLEIRLYTGRTHQIRAQMRLLGCPVLGDDKYGDREINRAYKKRKQMLLSSRLVLHFLKGSKLAPLEGLRLICPFSLTLPE